MNWPSPATSHSIPFYAVLSADDVDLDLPDGAAFGQGEGDPVAVTNLLPGTQAKGWTPAFDVVPASSSPG